MSYYTWGYHAFGTIRYAKVGGMFLRQLWVQTNIASPTLQGASETINNFHWQNMQLDGVYVIPEYEVMLSIFILSLALLTFQIN